MHNVLLVIKVKDATNVIYYHAPKNDVSGDQNVKKKVVTPHSNIKRVANVDIAVAMVVVHYVQKKVVILHKIIKRVANVAIVYGMVVIHYVKKTAAAPHNNIDKVVNVAIVENMVVIHYA